MLCLTWVLIQGGSGDGAKKGRRASRRMEDLWRRRLHGAQREHGGKLPGQGWDIRVTPNPLSENAHSLWEAGETGNSKREEPRE